MFLIRRIVMLKTIRRLLAKGLIAILIGFCSCLCASDNAILDEKTLGYSLDGKQRSSPIYRDNIFYKYVKGTVFFVVGTSSAGKSSIIKNLSKYIPRAKKEKFIMSGYDDLNKTLGLRYMRKFMGRLNFISQEDLWYCLLAAQTMPRKSIVEQLDIDLIFKKHQQLLLSDEWNNTIRQLSSCPYSEEDEFSFAENLMRNIVNGKNIILDVVKFMPFLFSLENNFIRCNIHNIYVYARPHALIQHTIQRLQKSLLTADKREMRLFFPYDQYMEIYLSTHFNTGLCLTKKEMSSDFTGVLHSIIKNSGLSDPEKKHLITLLKEGENMGKPWRDRIISEWFPGDTEVIYLKPKCLKVDLLLDTSILSTSKAISAILPILNSVINQE